jgi:hypothetical protein
MRERLEVSSKSITGMAPGFLEGKFPTLEDTSSGQKKIIKATAFSYFNSQNNGTISLNDIINSRRFIVVSCKNGIVQEMYIHSSWIQKIMNEKASEIALNVNGKGYTLIKENVKVIPLTDETYKDKISKFVTI